MGGRRLGRLISLLLAVALLAFGAVAGGVALADETVPRDPGGGPGRVPTDPPGDSIPTNPERGPSDGPIDPGGGLGGGGGGPVGPPVVTTPPPTTNPPGSGGGGGFGGGGTATDPFPGVDLTLTKTDSPDPVVAGANLTYTITVTNEGATAAPDATVQDQLPAVAAPVSSTPSQGSCSHTGGGEMCSLGAIAGGGTATVTFVVQVLPDVAAGTVLSNTAAVFTTVTEGTTTNNVDTETTTVATAADVTVFKSNAPNPVPTGTNLTYTIHPTNLGPSDAHTVSVMDAVPAGTTFVSFSAPAGWVITTPAVGGTGTVTATTPTLGANNSPTLTLVVHVTVPSGNLINNTATITSATTDPDAANNTGFSQASVVGSADLSVTKTDAPDPATAGNNVTYTITVTNNGPENAQNAALSDSIPSGTTFVSLSSPAGWSCTTPAVGATGTVSCGNPQLGGGSGVFTLVVNVNAAAAGGSTVSNTASVSSSTFDPSTGNNSATATTTVSASANLLVTKTDSPDPVTAGSNITYTISVDNAGPSDAMTQLTDGVPTGTTFVSFAAPAGWSLMTPVVGGTGGVTATKSYAVSEPAAVFTLVVKVNANASSGATITNLASVGSVTSDPDDTNNTSLASTTVNTSADLSVTKADSPDPVTAGNNLSYAITVANPGPSDALGVSLTDAVPAGNSFVSATTSQGSCAGTTTVTCALGTIPSGGSATITIVVNVNAGAPSGSTITNTATATTTTTDPNSANDSATTTTTVTTSADMAVTKTDSPDPVIAGNDLTYTIGVTNNGPSKSDGDVTVTDAVPAGTTFVSATPSQGSCSGTTTVTCNLGGLTNGASAAITLVVNVDPSAEAGATISNTTSVSAPAADPNTENNSATADTDVATSADVGLTKEAAPDPVTADNDLTYTMTATNDGPSDAQDVTVTDPLPAGTTFVSVTPSQGSCSGTTTVTCELGTIADGASATITLVVNVDVGTPGGTVITNTATASSPEPEVTAATADPADADNSASASVTVVAAPSAATPSANASVGTAGATAITTGAAGAAFAVVTVPRFTG